MTLQNSDIGRLPHLVKKRSMTRKTPTQIALDAIDIAKEARSLILKHEADCSERWRETTLELRGLRHQLTIHSKRWEKISWILATSFIAAAAATIISNLA